MNEKDKKRLRLNRKDIVTDVLVGDIKDHMIQQGILNAEDFREIESHSRRKVQMGTCLDLLVSKGPKAYACFREALEENYDWLVIQLDEGQNGSSDTVDAIAEGVGSLSLQANFTPNVALEHRLIRSLSKTAEVMRNWKNLARELKLSEGDIMEIEYANSNQLSECVYQTILKWQSVDGKSATVMRLYTALTKYDIPDLQGMFTK